MELWISTAESPDRGKLDGEWQRVGSLDDAREAGVARVLQTSLGAVDPSRARVTGFFGDIDPDSAWYRQLITEHPEIRRGERLVGDKIIFWLALRSADGPTPTTFFSCVWARLATLPDQAPVEHPDTQTIAMGIQLRAGDDGGFFTAIPDPI